MLRTTTFYTVALPVLALKNIKIFHTSFYFSFGLFPIRGRHSYVVK